MIRLNWWLSLFLSQLLNIKNDNSITAKSFNENLALLPITLLWSSIRSSSRAIFILRILYENLNMIFYRSRRMWLRWNRKNFHESGWLKEAKKKKRKVEGNFNMVDIGNSVVESTESINVQLSVCINFHSTSITFRRWHMKHTRSFAQTSIIYRTHSEDVVGPSVTYSNSDCEFFTRIAFRTIAIQAHSQLSQKTVWNFSWRNS